MLGKQNLNLHVELCYVQPVVVLWPRHGKAAIEGHVAARGLPGDAAVLSSRWLTRVVNLNAELAGSCLSRCITIISKKIRKKIINYLQVFVDYGTYIKIESERKSES